MRASIAGLLLLSACGSSPEKADEKPVIRIVGSESITSMLMPMLAHSYERGSANTGFQITGGGSHTGFRAMLDGNAELAASSRVHTPAEQEQAKANGFSLEEEGVRHIVAVDVVAISVHPSNPIDSLTYDQVIGIFCTRTIDNWSFLGLEDAPINPITRPPGSGTRALFEDFFCGPRGISSRIPAVTVEEANGMLKADPSAITFISMTESNGKIVGLRADTDGYPVLPSQQNIIRGAYPLYHDLYLYKGQAAGEDVDDFLRWIGQPAGQDIVDEARFVPMFLRPERLDDPRPLRETIHFEEASDQPNQRSQARMRMLVEELRERVGQTNQIVLEGYTDNREDDSVALSERRAQAVQGILEEQLPNIYFEVIPRGSEQPLAPNTTPYGRQRNRRVQIYLSDEESTGDITAGGQGDPPTE